MKRIVSTIACILILHCVPFQKEAELTTHEAGFHHLCQVFRSAEELGPTDDIYVFASTQPISELFALHLEYTDGLLTPSDAAEDEKLDNAYRQSFSSEPVPLPAGGNCSWKTTTSERSELYGADKLVLEVSGVIDNPFEDDTESRGYFARLSYGLRSGASWYWVAVEDSQVKVVPLDISDG